MRSRRLIFDLMKRYLVIIYDLSKILNVVGKLASVSANSFFLFVV